MKEKNGFFYETPCRYSREYCVVTVIGTKRDARRLYFRLELCPVSDSQAERGSSSRIYHRKSDPKCSSHRWPTYISQTSCICSTVDV